MFALKIGEYERVELEAEMAILARRLTRNLNHRVCTPFVYGAAQKLLYEAAARQGHFK